MPFQKPILLMIFNRPDMVREVAGRIASLSPSKIYIASDGPRAQVQGEDAKVQASRDTAIDTLTGGGQLNTLFQDKNLGCKKAVQTAIDWFFENEPDGIIIEDDCLPDPSFFDYCECLLDRYRDDMRIGMISGDNFQFGKLPIKSSYYYSHYAHVWGWATWRRVWRCYRSDKPFWEEMKGRSLLDNIFSSSTALRYWENIFERVYDGKIDTWDYQLNLSLWSQNMLSIIPAKNLVSNIGFSPDATHTKLETIFSRVSAEALEAPLSHPAYVSRNVTADRRFEDLYLNRKYRLLNKLKTLLMMIRSRKNVPDNGRQ